MSDLICPHCRGSVPRGAAVCRGCQAEIEYGAPPAAYVVVLVVSAIAGFQTSGVVPQSLSFLSWIIGIGVFVGGVELLSRIFVDRVIFKRIYKTK